IVSGNERGRTGVVSGAAPGGPTAAIIVEDPVGPRPRTTQPTANEGTLDGACRLRHGFKTCSEPPGLPRRDNPAGSPVLVAVHAGRDGRTINTESVGLRMPRSSDF